MSPVSRGMEIHSDERKVTIEETVRNTAQYKKMKNSTLTANSSLTSKDAATSKKFLSNYGPIIKNQLISMHMYSVFSIAK